MRHFRKSIIRLLDLSEQDGRTPDEAIETLQYYFSRIKKDTEIITVQKKEKIKEA